MPKGRFCAAARVFCNHVPAKGSSISGADRIMHMPDRLRGIASGAAVLAFASELVVKGIQVAGLDPGQLQAPNGGQDVDPQEGLV